MTTVGMLGGIGPESTVEYYRLLIAGDRQLRPDGSYPSIIINSIDVTKLLAWMGANQLSEVWLTNFKSWPGRARTSA
jgi:aspartate racemase